VIGSRLIVAALAIVTLVALSASAGDGTALRAGRGYSGSLPSRGQPYQTFVIRVPRGADRMDIRVDATGDADLYLKPGSAIVREWSKEAVAMSRGETGAEQISLDVDGIPTLRACTYYLDVVHGQGAAGKSFSFELSLEIETSRPGGAEPLPAAEQGNEWGMKVHRAVDADFEGRVTFDAGGERFRTFAIEVAPDVASMQVATSDSTADIDLYARHGQPMATWQEAEYAANSRKPDERLAIARTDTAPLRSGLYYVDVTNAVDGPAATTVSVRFERGYEGEEPSSLAPRPSAVQDVDGEIHADASFAIEIGNTGRAYRTFLVHVPQGTSSLLVRAIGARRDIDLHLRHTNPIADYTTDPDHSANGIQANEQLYIHGATAPPLRPGVYYLDVFRPYRGETGPIQVDVQYNAPMPDPLPASSAPIVDLTPGERVEASAPEGSKTTRFAVEVPADAESLHVYVFRASRDIDLFLRQDAEITDYNDPSGFHHKATSLLLDERGVIDADSTPPLKPGRYYIDAVSLIGKDEQIAFEIVATLDDPPAIQPDDLTLPPYLRTEDATDVERALEGVVAVSSEQGGGSGTCLSPGGYVLTNYHVVEQDGEVAEDDIYISFVERFDAPPRQVFVAKVVHTDPRNDLALLKVERDVYDRPLPENLQLPWVPIANPSGLRLADPLYVAGFPTVGGFESRTSISVARGIVSGYVSDADGDWVWIKTDARVNQGNSGGAAFTADGLLFIGVPSMEAIEEDDELGYCRPTSRIPQAWIDLIEADIPQDLSTN